MIIYWTPGHNGAEFKFNTHEEARSFIMKFLNATHLFHAKYFPDEQPIQGIRHLANGEYIPENHIRGWIYIEHMNDFFVQRDTTFRIYVSMVGGNNHLDITALLTSVIQYGPPIMPEQFNFKANWSAAHTDEENHQVEMTQILAIIVNSRSNPQVQFEFCDLDELKNMLGKNDAPKVLAAIETLDRNERNAMGFFANTPGANSQGSAPLAQDVSASLQLQPTLEQTKLRLLTQLLPNLTNMVRDAQNVENLLILETMVNRALRLCTEQNLDQALMEKDQPDYYDPPTMQGGNCNL